MQTKYDRFYRHDHERPPLQDIRFSGWPKDRVQAILALNLTGDTVLDVGCGDGGLLYQHRHRFKRLIGLEYSPGRLAAARANLRDHDFRGVCGSAEQMSEIESDSVDCIVTADVIEHIPDVYLASAEMCRVLKPGGTLAINTPNVAFLVKRLRLLVGRFPSTSQRNEGLGSDVLFDGGHLHYFTYRSLALLLERSGFVIERRIGFGPFGRLHDLRPGLTSVGVQLVARKPS